MPSGHHRSPERRDRDKGKREWKESRSENRDRSRKYDDSDRHRESNRSNRDEEFSSSSGKKKARKSDKLERSESPNVLSLCIKKPRIAGVGAARKAQNIS